MPFPIGLSGHGAVLKHIETSGIADDDAGKKVYISAGLQV